MPAFIHEIGRDYPARSTDLLDLSKAYRNKKRSDLLLKDLELFDGRVGWFQVSWCEDRVFAFFQNGVFFAPEVWLIEKKNIANGNRKRFPWPSIRDVMKRRQSFLRSHSFVSHGWDDDPQAA